MKRYVLSSRISAVLLAAVLITSCHGQATTKLPHRTESNAAVFATGQPKLTRTSGTEATISIRCGIQDNAGNLWFGTSGKGIYCYDGKVFTHFTTKDGLTSNAVNAILEDKKGHIWFATDAGACWYNGRSFTYLPIADAKSNTAFPVNPAYTNPGAKKNTVWSILQDKAGKFWFGTNTGLFCFDGTVITRFLADQRLQNPAGVRLEAVQSILEDRSGNIWLSGWFDGINRFDGKTLTNFKPNNEVWFVSLLEDRSGRIWASRRGNGLCRFDGNTFSNVWQRGALDSCTAWPAVEDDQGNIWFGATHNRMARREQTGGLWRYDGKSFANFTASHGLNNNKVTSVVLDKTGHLWVSTEGMGLFRFDSNTFTSFSD